MMLDPGHDSSRFRPAPLPGRESSCSAPKACGWVFPPVAPTARQLHAVGSGSPEGESHTSRRAPANLLHFWLGKGCIPSPAKFSSPANDSVSNEGRLQVRVAPRSQIFCELISGKVGSTDTRSASRTSSYPANRLYTDCRNRSAKGSCVLRPRRESLRCRSMSSPMPKRSSTLEPEASHHRKSLAILGNRLSTIH